MDVYDQSLRIDVVRIRAGRCLEKKGQLTSYQPLSEMVVLVSCWPAA
jgi:hypothetical protein